LQGPPGPKGDKGVPGTEGLIGPDGEVTSLQVHCQSIGQGGTGMVTAFTVPAGKKLIITDASGTNWFSLTEVSAAGAGLKLLALTSEQFHLTLRSGIAWQPGAMLQVGCNVVANQASTDLFLSGLLVPE